MEAPMSEWFQSVPLGLDSIAYAVKFQQDLMASEVRYHKSRHQQHRQLLERLKREVAELKNDNEALQHENMQYRLQMNQSGSYQKPSDNLNPNGKRQMLTTQQFDYIGQHHKTGSSPHPSGPQRLTLQPGHHPAELSSHKQREQEQSMSSRSYPPLRPESARSLERHAYAHQENRIHPPQLTYAQNARRAYPRRDTAQQHATENQLRPPPSARSRPAIASYASLSNETLKEATARHTLMGPPPCPQPIRNEGNGVSNKALNGQASGHHALSNNQPLLSAGLGQTAMPATPVPGQATSGIAPRRFFQPGAPSRASNATSSAEGQRTPFVFRSCQRDGFA
ncbi:hypothetical protein BDN70DRAFT_883159 [Pholiota conissans]|uniref:Uncharacterized protein n=1 Tax=Pholiota conissans TaxID=109636 RepID=A0A9P6CX27_9AGAR|nr:hypothetical protein BDN70DRAFT_883159 [Pholiota conissans]